MAKLTQDYGYKILENKFQDVYIPDGWEVVPVGSKDYKSYKCISNVSLKENLVNIKDWDANVVIGQGVITSGYPVTIRKIRAKKQNNKYPTKITWGGKDYVAPEGYYFLKVGDKLIKGDGFVILFEPKIIKYNNVCNKDYYVVDKDVYPSIRPIPVENKEKVIDNPAKIDKVEVVKPIIPVPKYEFKPITDINVGDIFVCPEYFNSILIVQSDWDTKYSISGRDGLNNYSNCQNVSKEVVIKYLNTHKKIFVTNINDKIKKSLEMAVEMVKNSK